MTATRSRSAIQVRRTPASSRCCGTVSCPSRSSRAASTPVSASSRCQRAIRMRQAKPTICVRMYTATITSASAMSARSCAECPLPGAAQQEHPAGAAGGGGADLSSPACGYFDEYPECRCLGSGSDGGGNEVPRDADRRPAQMFGECERGEHNDGADRSDGPVQPVAEYSRPKHRPVRADHLMSGQVSTGRSGNWVGKRQRGQRDRL